MVQFWSKVYRKHDDECWEWTGALRDGYGVFEFRGKKHVASRFAFELVNGPTPKGVVVRHSCDNRKCCNPHHLVSGSTVDNVKDMTDRGRHASQLGRFNNSKLTWMKALKIRYSSGSTHGIADQHEVCEKHVRDIKNGKRWSKLPDGVVKMTNEVVSWIHPMLPDRNPFDTSIKLASELSELQHSLHTGDGSPGEEAADCLILLLDLAFLLDIDLEEELLKKMDVNRLRKWEKVLGTLKHRKDMK